MKLPRALLFLTALLLLSACGDTSPRGDATPEGKNGVQASVDRLAEKIAARVGSREVIATIDHCRLAAKEGVPMPPSIVTIFRDPAVDAPLMKLNPRVGLDLPLKILAYGDGERAAVIYPGARFLSARHGITNDAALLAYDAAMRAAVPEAEESTVSALEGVGVTRDLAIVELASDYPYKETITRLKDAVLKQRDTVWFGEIDFGADGDDAPQAILLLFGGPKPGGVAMAKFPKLGLDAFCQKLLVYRDGDRVKVIFNDIAALAELHYGTSAKPHQMLNQRLTATFQGAVTREAK